MSAQVEEFDDLYRIEELLGRGLSCVVHRCVEISSGQEFAVKIINLETLMKEPDAADRVERIKREIQILNQIRHPSLISIRRVCSVPHRRLYIIMELCQGGELCELLVREGGHLSELLTRHIMVQIVRAVKYLHDLGIAHRDLKLENILFMHKLPATIDEARLAAAINGSLSRAKRSPTPSTPPSTSTPSTSTTPSTTPAISTPTPSDSSAMDYLRLFDVKIVDFGFARQISVPVSPGRSKMSPMERREAWTSPQMRGQLTLSFLGTAKFAAPEMIRHTPYDLRCDLYSIGVLLYFMLVGSFPFVTEQLNGQISLDLNEALSFKHPRWRDVSPAAKDLVAHLLVDENERYTADEFLEHPWITAPLGPHRCARASRRRKQRYHHRAESVKAHTNQVIDFKRGREGDEVVQIDGKLAKSKKRAAGLHSGPKIVLHTSFSELPSADSDSDSDSDSTDLSSRSSSTSPSPSLSPLSSPLASPPGSPPLRGSSSSSLLTVPKRIARSPSPIRLDSMGLSRSR